MIPKQIVIHHSASRSETTLMEIDQWHKSRGFNFGSKGYYIGYHYVIFPNGDVKTTRSTDEMGCHCVPNDHKIGICLIGDFSNQNPPAKQLETLQVIVEALKRNYGIPDTEIYGHCEFKATVCPGKVMRWVRLYRKLGFIKDQIRILKARISNKKEKYNDGI